MTKKFVLSLSLFLAVSLMQSATSRASTEAWDFSTAANAYTNGNWTFGEVFVPTQNIAVDFLGYYAAQGLGNFNSDHPVGMFDANGNLLASTTIDNSSSFTTSSGHFAFNPIASITLLAGHTYVLEGVSNSDNYTWNDPDFTVYAPINILGNNWILGNGLNFNGTFLINDVTDGEWGANFGFTGVTSSTPEPGSLMLLSTGLLGVGGLLRRRLWA